MQNYLHIQLQKVASLSERILPYTFVDNLSELIIPRPDLPDDDNLIVPRTKKENPSLGTVMGPEFSVVSYNILCQDYVSPLHYLHCYSKYKTQEYRLNLLLKEESKLKSDFYAFQEVNPSSYEFLKKEMELRGYKGEYIKKSREGKDGVATFFKTKDIRLLQIERLELDVVSERVCRQLNLDANQLGLLLKTVALFCLFEITDSSTGKSNLVVIGNVHINYDWTRHDMQCFQVAKTIESLHAFAQKYNTSNIILCGDFNIMPKTIGHRLMTTGTCSLEDFERWRVVPITLNGQLTYNYKELKGQFQHPISNFQSAYASLDERKQEPEFTNYVKGFRGCLDYILFTGELQVKDILNLVNEKDIEPLGYCPNQRFLSDHLSLRATFTF